VTEKKDWITRYLKLTDNSEPPIIFRTWTAISVLASALQHRVGLQWVGGSFFYPNFMIALTSPPAKARKGTAIRQGLQFIEDCKIILSVNAPTIQVVINTLDKATRSYKEPNSTVIKLHSSLSVIAEELVVFTGYKNPEFVGYICEWFDCPKTPWSYETIGRGKQVIPGIWLNLLGGITPQLLALSIPPEIVGSGLTSRMIFPYAERISKKVLEPWYIDEEITLYHELLEDLKELLKWVGSYDVDNSFKKSYSDWYLRYDADALGGSGILSHYYQRKQTHLLKLAMIINASRFAGKPGGMVLSRDDFEGALKLLDSTEIRMDAAFSSLGASPIATLQHRVLTAIITYSDKVNEKVPAGHLQREFQNDADARTMSSVLRTLEASGYITVTMAGKDSYVSYKDNGSGEKKDE